MFTTTDVGARWYCFQRSVSAPSLSYHVQSKGGSRLAPGTLALEFLLRRSDTNDTVFFFFFLSERTSLERCCVHNMSPFVSSSGLSPGSREAKVQRAKVCLNCTEPRVARSSCW